MSLGWPRNTWGRIPRERKRRWKKRRRKRKRKRKRKRNRNRGRNMERHPDLATASDSVLIVIDPQEKLVRMIHNREEVEKNIEMLLSFASIFALPIVLTEHYPKGLGHTVENIRERLPVYQPIEKRIFSCFGVPEFDEALRATGRTRLVVCGIETHICVEQTVLDALHRRYRVLVIADAAGTRFEKDHRVGLERMRRAGAIVTTTEAVMYEIAERAEGERFKRLLDLVK
jgi:nicotinamidase-related amidase